MKTVAFWSYEKFPYLLHANVIEEAPEGRVKVEGYGSMQVKPKYLLPRAHGAKVAQIMDSLTYEYNQKAAELKKEYTNKILELF